MPVVHVGSEEAGVYLPPAKRRRLQQLQQLEQQQEREREAAAAQAAATAASSNTNNDNHDEGNNDASLHPPPPPPSPPKQLSSSSLVQLQRQSWEEQKRVIHGTINRLNTETIKPLIGDLFSKVNLIRCRGLLAKSLLQAALTSSTSSSNKYAPVYASLVAVINSKLPEVGELIVKRAILHFRTHYRRHDKAAVLAMSIFLGHLFHQNVVHELILLQILTLLLGGGGGGGGNNSNKNQEPTDDAIEVAAQLLATTGYALLQVSPAGVRAVTERLRALLHEGSTTINSNSGFLNKRVQYKIEHLLELRKNGFRDVNECCYPPIPPSLDLVEADDQITLEELTLDDETLQKEDHLDVFKVDPNFEENEQTWAAILDEIIGRDDGDDDNDDDDDATTDSGKEGGDHDDDKASEDGDEEEPEPDQQQLQHAIVPVGSRSSKGAMVVVQDLSEADLVHLRRQIYLTIMSAATFEETAHKLARMDIPLGREEELVNMLIECCSQERTFQRHYGMVAGRFCLLADRWRDAFCDSFAQQYATIHRLETNKLRNVAKLFAHLLHTDSIPWSVLSNIHLNEDETTSSSRIFLKILVQEMAEALGMARLKERFDEGNHDPEKAEWYREIFPRDNVRKTRYAINFFTSIGLGPLTDGLRLFLRNAPKLILQQAQENAQQSMVHDNNDADSSSVVSSSSSSSLSSTSSSSSSSSSYSSRRSRSSRSSSSSASSSTSSNSRRRRRSRGRSRRRRRGGGRSGRSLSSSSASSSSSSSSRRSSRSSRSRTKRRGRSKSPSSPPPLPPSQREVDKNNNHGKDDEKNRQRRRRDDKEPSSFDKGKYQDKELGRQRGSERLQGRSSPSLSIPREVEQQESVRRPNDKEQPAAAVEQEDRIETEDGHRTSSRNERTRSEDGSADKEKNVHQEKKRRRSRSRSRSPPRQPTERSASNDGKTKSRHRRSHESTSPSDDDANNKRERKDDNNLVVASQKGGDDSGGGRSSKKEKRKRSSSRRSSRSPSASSSYSSSSSSSSSRGSPPPRSASSSSRSFGRGDHHHRKNKKRSRSSPQDKKKEREH